MICSAKNTTTSRMLALSATALALVGLSSCSKNPAGIDKAGDSDEAQQGDGPSIISVDGSSTVFPITEAVAEEFQKGHEARVTIGVSGTGGGFKKFCAKETVVTGASRPIRPSEVEMCKQSGVDYIELPVAYDGISVVVHPDNDWASVLTVDELKRIWQPQAQGRLLRWNQIRPEWPDKEIHLFGPGVDSGTYDYFTKAIVGVEHASRGDFTSSEDDNVLVQGVSTDPLALGFFGYAFYSENQGKLQLVAIDDEQDDNGKGPISPSPETVADGTYQPLSRPIFVYVNKAASRGSDLHAFVEYYLTQGQPLVAETGYIPLPDRAYALALERFTSGVAGSVFSGEGSKVGLTVEQLLTDN